MRIKSGFTLYSMGDEHIVVPIDERTNDFHGMIKLNGTGEFLWSKMGGEFTEEGLAGELLNKYEVSESDAQTAVKSFLAQLDEVIER